MSDETAMSDGLARDKADLRVQAQRVRAGLTGTLFPRRALMTPLTEIARPGEMLSAYLAIGTEVDMAHMVEPLLDRGIGICLPVVTGPERPLVFRRWQPGEKLDHGPLKTRHPSPEADEVTPDVLVVPLLAFDRQGFRLGWGGGYYDRTLAVLRKTDPSVRAVGVAFAGQEVDTVPRDPYDQCLDWILTEREAIQISIPIS